MDKRQHILKIILFVTNYILNPIMLSNLFWRPFSISATEDFCATALQACLAFSQELLFCTSLCPCCLLLGLKIWISIPPPFPTPRIMHDFYICVTTSFSNFETTYHQKRVTKLNTVRVLRLIDNILQSIFWASCILVLNGQKWESSCE